MCRNKDLQNEKYLVGGKIFVLNPQFCDSNDEFKFVAGGLRFLLSKDENDEATVNDLVMMKIETEAKNSGKKKDPGSHIPHQTTLKRINTLPFPWSHGLGLAIRTEDAVRYNDAGKSVFE
ncbi:hypothetical protein Tsp_01586 [Trichinella spiralis]|uniref:hypothetical protein n=1 Tax=Trichinella spiralis TaxID=6334 RepID=UPI0001EFC099|nr:hypothetical protein Tsp_01586 [Trichinella spiralis]